MTKLAPEWVRTNDPVIRSPARYRWTTAPAQPVVGGGGVILILLEFLWVTSLCGATSVNWLVGSWCCLVSCVRALLVGSTIVLEGVV